MLLATSLILVLTWAGCVGPNEHDYVPHPETWADIRARANAQFTPQWTPDGTHIVFTAQVNRDGTAGHGSIYLAASDGSSVYRISKGDGGHDVDHSVEISPDGSRLVYATSRHLTEGDYYWGKVARNFEIETSALDGSDPLRLTHNSELDTSPAWSPDGDRIAFAKEFDNSADDHEPGIYTMASDGTDLRLIVPHRKRDWEMGEDVADIHHESGPVWSPDGEMLAFVFEELEYERDEEGKTVVHQISRGVLYVVGADGSGLTRLFAASDTSRDSIIGPPAWSPDGKLIRFLHFDRNVKLYTIDPKGSDLREVVDTGLELVGRGRDSGLEWSPDGTDILFALGKPRSPSHGFIFMVDMEGSDLRRVGEEAYGSWSPDGSRIAVYQPNGCLFVVDRDGSSRQVLVGSGRDGSLIAGKAR